jgi:histone H3/H4
MRALESRSISIQIAEVPPNYSHRIEASYYSNIEGLLENISRFIATEAANSAKSRKGRTVSMGDIEVSASKSGLPAMLYEELWEAMRKEEEELTQ